MEIEYEASYRNVNKNEVRKILKKAGAKLIKKEFLQRKVVFNMPNEKKKGKRWLRVRDEQDKITMSIKEVSGNRIEDQKELCLKIDDFNNAILFLKELSCKDKAYQESKRELWRLDGADITIDEWPFLEPYVEIEAKSEEIVKKVSKKLGFDYSKAYFGAVDGLYSEKYSISKEKINENTPKILFDMKNPFI